VWDPNTPMPHPSASLSPHGLEYSFEQQAYPSDYVNNIAPRHTPPQALHEKAAFYAVQITRTLFDKATGYGPHCMTEDKWLQRMIFLETVAGVPGIVGGMVRHLRSLRLMVRDRGWIHTLLEEAENERMHLLTFMRIRKPSGLFRMNVLLAQGLFCNLYFMFYLFAPKYCHAFVGYLEEEAVKTYTHALEDIDSGTGRLPWATKAAPEIAKHYWRLRDDATMRDVILAVRADEACHSHVNHTLSKLPHEASNPFTNKGGGSQA